MLVESLQKKDAMRRQEKGAKEKLDSFMSEFFQKRFQGDWDPMWYHRCGQSKPTWRNFVDGERHICAVTPFIFNGRSYWLTVHPPTRVSWTRLMAGGIVALLAGSDLVLKVWKADPRRLKDSPSAYAATHPGAERRQVTTLQEFRRAIGA